jgi:hypothetical protein
LALCALAALVAAHSGCMATWHAADPTVPMPSTLHGDLTCGAGEADCNTCAENVAAQFGGSGWSRGNAEWHFQKFQSSHGVTVDRAYHNDARHHVQGFVRLNGPGVRYAMVHSGGRTRRGILIAPLSLVVQRPDGESWLSELLPLSAEHGHTSGLFTLGRHVGMFTRDNRLALLDVAAGLNAPVVEVELLKAPADFKRLGLSTRSGGVAMVRVAEGGYLLVANEGGDGPSSGHSHFFHVLGDLPTLAGGAEQHPIHVVPLGEYQYPVSPPGPTDYHHSENLTLITECGTGELYTVHVGSSAPSYRRRPKPKLNLVRNPPRTFWRVSRVVISQQSPRLEPLGVYTRPSTLERCYGRAAGSAFVLPDHRIEVSCHQRAHALTGQPLWRFWRHVSELPPPPEVPEVLDALPGGPRPGAGVGPPHEAARSGQEVKAGWEVQAELLSVPSPSDTAEGAR